ncbi:MAG TPA: hypothetical protein VMF51_20645 [Nocardioides sp.]|uniref:hypothetical protein n=1 Tax=Nocardioides sp. TaxID=35761 RepID=UPI002C7F7088|nr:hypothetical protein [Nocardioides sp.]HTW17549.1 hypothetical protein [Nocardioides sp.]
MVAPVTGRIAAAPANPDARERVPSTPNAARRRTVISSGIAIAPPVVGAACAIAPESRDATGRGAPGWWVGAGVGATPRSATRRTAAGADGVAIDAPGESVLVAAAGACVTDEAGAAPGEVGAEEPGVGVPEVGVAEVDVAEVDVAEVDAREAGMAGDGADGDGVAEVGVVDVGVAGADAAGLDPAGLGATGFGVAVLGATVLGATGPAGVRRISVGAAAEAVGLVVRLPDAGCAGAAGRPDPEGVGTTGAEPADVVAAAAAIPGATVERPTWVAGRIAVSTTSGLHIRRIERAVVRNRLPGTPPSGAASISRAVCWGAGVTGAAGAAEEADVAGPAASPGAAGAAAALAVPVPTDRAASLAGTGADGSAGRRWIVGPPGTVVAEGSGATRAEVAGAWESGAAGAEALAAGADGTIAGVPPELGFAAAPADALGAASSAARSTAAIAAVEREMPATGCPTAAIAAVGRAGAAPGAGAGAAAAASRRIAAWRMTTLVAPHRSRREDGAAVCERVIRSEPPGRIATGDDTADVRWRSPVLVGAVASCSTACGPRPATGARRTTLVNRGRDGESCQAERRTSADGLAAALEAEPAVDGAVAETGDGPEGPPRSPSAPASPALEREEDAGPLVRAPESPGVRGATRAVGATGAAGGAEAAGGADAAGGAAAGVRRTAGAGADGAAAASAAFRAAVAACRRAWSAAISIGPAAAVSVWRRTFATSACRPPTMLPGLQLCSFGTDRAARGSSRPPSCSTGTDRDGASQRGADVAAATERRSPTARPGASAGAAATSGEAGIGTHQRGGRT